MNWTEGNLARHTHGRRWKENETRQREFFAKGRLLVKPEKAPISISFPPSVPLKHSSPSSRRSSSHGPRPAARAVSSRNPRSSSRRDQVSREPRQSPQRTRHGPRSLKRKVPPLLGHPGHDAESLDVEAKRIRLLERPDWARVGIQKPLLMNFPAHGNTSKRVNHSKHSQQPATRSHFFEPISSDRGRSSTHDHNHDIRVRIGSQEFRHGVSSSESPQPSKQPRGPSRPHVSSSAIIVNSSPFVPRYNPLRDSNTPVRRLHYSGIDTVNRVIGRGKGPRKAPPASSCTPLTQLGSYSRKAKMGHRGSPLPRPAESFQVPLCHPVPRRIHQLTTDYHSVNSDDLGSLAPQVEREQSPMAASFAAENDKWKDFLGLDSEAPFLEFSQEVSAKRVATPYPHALDHHPPLSVSSTYQLHAVVGYCTTDSVDVDDSVGQPDLPPLPRAKTSSPMPLKSPRDVLDIRSSAYRTAGAAFPSGRSPRHRHPPTLKPLAFPTAPTLSTISAPSNPQALAQPEVHQVERNRKQAETDENELWKAFVCGGDSDDVEEIAFSKAIREAARDIVPSDHHAPPVASSEEYPKINFPPPPSISESLLATLASSPSPSPPPRPQEPPQQPIHRHAPEESSSTMLDSVAGHLGSTYDDPPRQTFKFAPPKVFEGRLVGTTRPPSLASVQRTMTKTGGRRKGRSRKRTKDGRANIRSLPDFDEDPIEE